MKMRFVIPMLLCAFTAFISCSKNNDGPENPDQDQSPDDTSHLGAPYFVGMVRVSRDSDTTLFKYDVNKRLINIVDTYVGESMTGTYNSAGNLSQVVINDDNDNGSSYIVSYAYNAGNQLIRIGRKSGSGELVDTIIYVNGVVAKKSTYSIDLPGSGKPVNWGYATYEVTDGNITRVMSYDSGGNLIADGTITYNSDLNIFKSLALYCASGNLFVADIAGEEAMFNKNMIAGENDVTNAQAHLVGAHEYTYDDKKRLIMSVLSGTFNGSPDQNTTRTFFY